jgi:Bacterial regulatory protein, Fis family
MLFQCKQCECRQKPSERCRRCGKEFTNPAIVQARPTQQDPPLHARKALQVSEAINRPGRPLKKIAELEREEIIAALERYGAVQAAEALGLGKTTFYYRLKRYGIPTPRVAKHREIFRKLEKQDKKSRVQQQSAEINSLPAAESGITQTVGTTICENAEPADLGMPVGSRLIPNRSEA